jgi:nitrite reductase/ring-hydroxylating ferredoxin subunit
MTTPAKTENELDLSPEARGFHRVATVDEIPTDRGFRVKIENKHIAIFKVEEKIYAINALCPHAGAFLDMGYMNEHSVICPMHGWDFDVRSGESPTYGISTSCYETCVEGDTVYVKP